MLTNFAETQLNGNNISSVFRLSNFHVSVFCCGKLESVIGTKLVDQIRHRFENVYIQGFDPEAIFGLQQHLIEALKITFEALLEEESQLLTDQNLTCYYECLALLKFLRQ